VRLFPFPVLVAHPVLMAGLAVVDLAAVPMGLMKPLQPRLVKSQLARLKSRHQSLHQSR
jgi:hypothetical protein